MNGLDLFSGIGGLTRALDGYVIPAAYCEIEPYARGVLLSRIASGDLPYAPIWDDVRTLKGAMLPRIDIIYGGFPCQDISVAGRGKGLEGERSSLFFEVVRLAEETKPKFVFLENVPNIRTKGLDRVVRELADLGYDCRWGALSATDVGANHKRKRWFLLAKSAGGERDAGPEEPGELQAVHDDQERAADNPDGSGKDVAEPTSPRCDTWIRTQGRTVRDEAWGTKPERLGGQVANADELRRQQGDKDAGGHGEGAGAPEERRGPADGGWWATEPNVGRVAYGVPRRVDRLRALGNAVVPQQAREAFERLIGLK